MVAVQSAVHIRVFLVYSGSGYAGGLAKKISRNFDKQYRFGVLSCQGSKLVEYVFDMLIFGFILKV